MRDGSPVIEQMRADDPDLEDVMDICNKISEAMDGEELHNCLAAVGKLYLELLLACYPNQEDRRVVMAQVMDYWRKDGADA